MWDFCATVQPILYITAFKGTRSAHPASPTNAVIFKSQAGVTLLGSPGCTADRGLHPQRH